MVKKRFVEVGGRWVEVVDGRLVEAADAPAGAGAAAAPCAARTMRRMGIVLAIAVIAFGIFRGCGRDDAPSRGDPSIRLVPPWPPISREGVEVSKDLLAKNYYVVVDGSGSMKDQACSGNQSKLEIAKSAVAAFAQSVPADANLGLQVFDISGVQERLPLGTGNRERFIQLVNSVRATGSTPLRESVRQAYARLLDQGMKQLGYGEYHLVIVTDGEADRGQDPGPVVNPMLGESPIVMHTIGFCIGGNHSLNQSGRTLYQAADDANQLRKGLADVLAEAPQFKLSKFK